MSKAATQLLTRLRVLAAQRGDQQAFSRLVEQHHSDLLAFAMRLCGDTAMAQDAVQDTWLAIAKSLRRLQNPAAFRVWLYRQLRWRVLDLQRTASRMTPLDSEVSAPENREWHSPLLQRAKLSAEEQQCLHLFYLEQLRIDEIASVLNVPSGTVKSRLHRARKHLHQLLQQEKEHEPG